MPASPRLIKIGVKYEYYELSLRQLAVPSNISEEIAVEFGFNFSQPRATFGPTSHDSDWDGWGTTLLLLYYLSRANAYHSNTEKATSENVRTNCGSRLGWLPLGQPNLLTNQMDDL